MIKIEFYLSAPFSVFNSLSVKRDFHLFFSFPEGLRLLALHQLNSAKVELAAAVKSGVIILFLEKVDLFAATVLRHSPPIS